MTVQTDLQRALAHLARSAPSSWDELLAAYRAYNTEILKQIISAPVESVHVAQGRAKHSDEFLRLLESALTTATQIEQRNRENG